MADCCQSSRDDWQQRPYILPEIDIESYCDTQDNGCMEYIPMVPALTSCLELLRSSCTEDETGDFVCAWSWSAKADSDNNNAANEEHPTAEE